jgi:hypothetical protein
MLGSRWQVVLSLFLTLQTEEFNLQPRDIRQGFLIILDIGYRDYWQLGSQAGSE